MPFSQIFPPSPSPTESILFYTFFLLLSDVHVSSFLSLYFNKILLPPQKKINK